MLHMQVTAKIALYYNTIVNITFLLHVLTFYL